MSLEASKMRTIRDDPHSVNSSLTNYLNSHPSPENVEVGLTKFSEMRTWYRSDSGVQDKTDELIEDKFILEHATLEPSTQEMTDHLSELLLRDGIPQYSGRIGRSASNLTRSLEDDRIIFDLESHSDASKRLYQNIIQEESGLDELSSPEIVEEYSMSTLSERDPNRSNRPLLRDYPSPENNRLPIAIIPSRMSYFFDCNSNGFTSYQNEVIPALTEESD